MAGSITDMISAGDLDGDLTTIRHFAEERLKTVRGSRSTRDFALGDVVTFNELCGVQILRGGKGTVVSIDRARLTVCLEKPIGRFVRLDEKTGISYPVQVKVPPEIIDRLR